MQKVREKLAADFPDVATYLQAGGLVDSVVNQGKPAPIDIQIGGNNLQQAYAIAKATAAKVKRLDSVNDVLIPQDLELSRPRTEHQPRTRGAARYFP